jgi:hypothetical protein
MLLATGSALVAGQSFDPGGSMKMQEVRVTRAFYFQGEVQEVGQTLSVPLMFAAELRQAKKAEYVEPDLPVAGEGGDHAG